MGVPSIEPHVICGESPSAPCLVVVVEAYSVEQNNTYTRRVTARVYAAAVYLQMTRRVLDNSK